MEDRRKNGPQEFGELKATVAALGRSVEDLKDDTRAGFLRLESMVVDRLKSRDEIQKNHEQRIGGLERWRAWVLGSIGMLLFLWPLLTAVFLLALGMVKLK